MTTEQKFEDPKIQLILSIIKHDDRITELLENRRWTDAAQSMCYLFMRFDISNKEEDKKILEATKTLTLENYHQATREDLAYAYKIYHDFLNRTYYKGFSNNRPQTRRSSIEEIGENINT